MTVLMTILKTIINPLLSMYIKYASDEDLLTTLAKFLDRVYMNTEFVTDQGRVVGQILEISVGDYSLTSDPSPVTWPLVLDDSGLTLLKKDLN